MSRNSVSRSTLKESEWIRVDDHPGEPGGVEQPLLLVELPAARLLRHQPPLEPVGELGDRALEVDELLVEIGAQPPQFLLVAQGGRRDLLVILGGEDPVVEPGRQLGDAAGSAAPASAPPRPPRRARRRSRPSPRSTRRRFDPRRSGPAARGSRRRRGRRLRPPGRCSSSPPSASSSPSPSSPASGSRSASPSPSTSSRSRSNLVASAANAAWSSIARPERVEVGAGFLLDPVGDRGEPRARGLGRRLAGQPLAHDQPDRRSQRHLLAAARPDQRIGPEAQLGEVGEVGADARHAARAQCLDPRLLGGVEHRAGGLVGGRVALVEPDIVVPEPQRRRVGEAARLGRLPGARSSAPASAP